MSVCALGSEEANLPVWLDESENLPEGPVV